MTKHTSDAPSSLITMNIRQLMMVLVTGIAAGLVAWGMTLLLDAYVYKAVLCDDASAGQCASSFQYATITAMVLAAAVSLFALVKLQVFRPLLVVIATFIAMWGLVSLTQTMPWYVAAPVCAGLYAVALATFAWIARIRHFLVALIVMVVTIVVVRLVLNS